MTQEQELFTILSSMILNKVYCRWENCPSKFKDSLFRVQGIQLLDSGGYMLLLECMDDLSARFTAYDITKIKPFLRPMSSMTEEEKTQADIDYSYNKNTYGINYAIVCYINYLYSIHVDCYGLIEKEMALPAPEGMYMVGDELPEPPETDLYRYKNEESI